MERRGLDGEEGLTLGIVTLTTDFGTADGYVGEMKGVILSLAPEVLLVDVTHEVPPGDVDAASWVLNRLWERFPERSVHLVVVDPGVGGPRRPVGVRSRGRWFIGPDNGLLTDALAGRSAEEVRLLRPESFGAREPSSTFHGRDLFAPAAAWLASGRPPMGLGPSIQGADLMRRERPEPEHVGGSARGHVVHIDRFGNLITDSPAGWLAPTALVEVGGQTISGIRSSYASVSPGDLVAVIGSAGTLEISLRDGSASGHLQVRRGGEVRASSERI